MILWIVQQRSNLREKIKNKGVLLYNMRHLLLGTLGALALGLVSPTVSAEEIEEYVAMSHSKTNRLLRERAIYITDNNFRQEVLEYDGAVILLDSSSCTDTAGSEEQHRNIDSVFLKLQEQYADVEVNGLPIKFAYLDACKHGDGERRLAYSVFELFNTGTETLMFVGGEEIDRLTGAPSNLEGANLWYDFLANDWIPTNLTEPNGQWAWRFQGTHDEKKIPYQP